MDFDTVIDALLSQRGNCPPELPTDRYREMIPDKHLRASLSLIVATVVAVAKPIKSEQVSTTRDGMTEHSVALENYSVAPMVTPGGRDGKAN